MGIESILKVAAPVVGGLLGSKKGPSSSTTTQQQQLDPRISQMLFGDGGANKGLLSQYQGLLNQGQSGAANTFNQTNQNYLGNYGGADMEAARNAAYRAMQGNQAPQSGGAAASLPAYAVGAQVQAPGQNSVDTAGSYNSLINGAPGANPYLTGAIQKGINQSSNAFGNMLTDAKSATQDLLGNVRGGAIAAGQYGGSRQALAEGKAIDSFNTNISRAASQFGQNNTDAAVAAQAGAYNSDRDRQLAATQGLSGQQYGVAGQNAAYQMQAQQQNVQNSLDVSKTNAAMNQQNQQFNAGLQQQNNSLNSGNNLAGAGLLSGLLGGASNQVNAGDNWQLNRYQGVNSLLAPYLSANQSSSVTQPLYQDRVGGAIGGALAGSQLGGLFGGGGGGGLASLFGPNTIGTGF